MTDKGRDGMNKHDIKRNLPMLSGKLGSCGYDRWCHSFTGVNRDSGEKKVFFVQYCVVNPELGGKKPVIGKKPFQRPAYLMVKAGVWGKDGFTLNHYYGIEEMDVAGTFLKVTAGDCFLSDNNIWGRLAGAHKLMWSLHMDKKVAFNVGYSTSKPVREINPFDMYWHTEGMRTDYAGKVTLDGNIYEVTPESCHGYADKKWGRDYTCPWFWLYGNQMKSRKTGKILTDSAFAIGGGNPVVLGFHLLNKPFACVYYEGRSREINYSEPWTFARMRFACGMRDGKVLWHMKAMNLTTAMEVRIVCDEDELQEVEYQNPMGQWNRDQMIGGGTGRGEILLYRRKGKHFTLIDRIYVKGVGCEYTGKK